MNNFRFPDITAGHVTALLGVSAICGVTIMWVFSAITYRPSPMADAIKECKLINSSTESGRISLQNEKIIEAIRECQDKVFALYDTAPKNLGD